MKKIKKCEGFLGCRTSKKIEDGLKTICDSHNREVSEVLNYLCRLFIEDTEGIRTRFLSGGHMLEPGLEE